MSLINTYYYLTDDLDNISAQDELISTQSNIHNIIIILAFPHLI